MAGNPALWLTIEQLSDRLGVPVKTLRYWRSRGYGPPGVKLGPGAGTSSKAGSLRYRLADVERWERDAVAGSAS